MQPSPANPKDGFVKNNSKTNSQTEFQKNLVLKTQCVHRTFKNLTDFDIRLRYGRKTRCQKTQGMRGTFFDSNGF